MIGDDKPKRQPVTAQKSNRTPAPNSQKSDQKASKAPFSGRPFKRPKTGGGK